jgi:hypothetical protein
MLSIFIGATIEVLLFVSDVPKDSAQPMTPWQFVVGCLFWPFTAVLWLTQEIAAVLPNSLTALWFFFSLSLAFFSEATVLALPAWIAIKLVLKYRRSTSI